MEHERERAARHRASHRAGSGGRARRGAARGTKGANGTKGLLGKPIGMAVAAVGIIAMAGAAPTSTKAAVASAPAARLSSSAPSKASGSASASGATSSSTAVAQQVLAVINNAREQVGLKPYTVSNDLVDSAGAHNARMADGCGLSHQCPGESALGDRETAAGVQWTAAGENIGDGGPVDDTQSAIARMAVDLTDSMLAERPPDDGHRLNILSSNYTEAGIAVTRDGSGTVWMTQDFAN